LKIDRRGDFRKLHLTYVPIPREHSHPTAAANRTAVRNMIDQYGILSGQPLYYVSMSDGENKAGSFGDRWYYVSKDLLQRALCRTPKGQMTRVLVDVDYYVDMSKIGRCDYILYTTDPQKLGGSTSNGCYSISNDVYTLDVNGGAKYVHHLWDYNTDVLFQFKWYGGNLFTVEHKRLDDHRTLVFLNYRRTVYTPLAWWWFNGKSLKRKQVSDVNGFNHQKVIRKDGTVVHNIAKQGVCFSVDLTEQMMNNVLVRTSYSKQPQISDVERLFKSADMPNALESAALIYDYIVKSGFMSKTLVSDGFEDSYQTIYPLVTEDGKPSARRLLPPILDEGVAPVKSYNNDVACVNGRINAVKNQVTKYPGFYYKCMKEFIDFCIPEAGILTPQSFDSQSLQMNRPTQQSLIEKFRNFMFYNKPIAVSSFQKAEVYGKITSPRNISTLPMSHNFRLGQYSQALSQILKQHWWYAFGKHPREIATTMLRLATNATTAVPSDISKMDGSCGRLLSDLEIGIMRKAVAPELEGEISELMSEEIKIKGFTRHGLSYVAEYNTLSGSAATSWKNTVKNAFTVYLSFRLAGHEPNNSWLSLGIYGGDDGVTFDVNPDQINRTFAKIGMLAKCEKIEIGQPVPFLGRVFVDPWTTTESFIDIPRQMRKLHLTTSPKTIPDNVVLFRKAEAYLVTDPLTPLISHWSLKVLQLLGRVDLTPTQLKLTQNDISYWTKFEAPFEPLSLSSVNVAIKWAAAQLNMSPNDFLEKCRLMLTARTLQELHSVKFNSTLPVEINSVYRGQLINGTGKDHQKQIRAALAGGRKPRASRK